MPSQLRRYSEQRDTATRHDLLDRRTGRIDRVLDQLGAALLLDRRRATRKDHAVPPDSLRSAPEFVRSIFSGAASYWRMTCSRGRRLSFDRHSPVINVLRG